MEDAHFEADLRSALSALAAFAEVLSAPEFIPGEFVAARELQDGSWQIGFSSLSDEANAFVQAAYQNGWIQPFDWPEWRDSDEARRLLNDPACLDRASPQELSRLMTAIVRQDRFCDGVLLSEFENGIMAGVARRAKSLLDD
ncbi:DUF6508 domain-containing protein [Phenylobacterium sp.]|jgi:hypothetical protein|uniref:DUF6508 domain-containing protein n=1 Tax=Phenylobacterium sp. TaxID=1871053 RepID=UPI002F93FFF1